MSLRVRLPPYPGHAVVLAALSLAAACTPAHAPTRELGLAVVGATVFDGTDAPPLADAFVVVEGDRIKAVGPQSHVPLPKGVPVIDARGKFVVPYLDPARKAQDTAVTSTAGRSAVDTLADIWKSAGVQALAAGSPADFLILDADPRIDLANLSRVHRTVQGGRVMAPPAANP